ncbi:HTH DNA-binding protein [Methanospirillum hungatei JF-1]|uniref:HTH DNA-binding protein n=2 Tax=Methanospirillum hungatei TaxID=2203 RepID=Q2FSU1_METHJ|nr:HTH DNA-binding protein [Methanospirillum hungatei JF-1]
MSENGMLRCYGPRCEVLGEIEAVVLLPEEIEVIRLIDLEGMEQEEAASFLGVSRRTVWKDLHDARRKVADALVHGKMIEVAGCVRQGGNECPKNQEYLCPRDAHICPRKGPDDLRLQEP